MFYNPAAARAARIRAALCTLSSELKAGPDERPSRLHQLRDAIREVLPADAFGLLREALEAATARTGSDGGSAVLGIDRGVTHLLARV